MVEIEQARSTFYQRQAELKVFSEDELEELGRFASAGNSIAIVEKNLKDYGPHMMEICDVDDEDDNHQVAVDERLPKAMKGGRKEEYLDLRTHGLQFAANDILLHEGIPQYVNHDFLNKFDEKYLT